MPEELKQYVKQSLKDGSNIERTIFDNMEQEVTRAITESTYQAFLRSEAYVSYVSAATQPLSSPDTSPPHAVRERSVYSAHVSYAGYCPASRQDSERASLSSGRTDSDAVSLSGSSVDGVSMRRETRESRHRARLHGMDRHAVINKEQDGAMRRSVDAARVAAPRQAARHGQARGHQQGTRWRHGETTVIHRDGVSMRRESRHRARLHGMDRHAVINKEQDGAMVIPRTHRVQSEQLRVLPPDEFAPLLIEKLERVRRDQESKERLERRLNDILPRMLGLLARLGDWFIVAVSGCRSMSKKTVTELTDSGVSVVSEAAGSGQRLLLWVADGVERRAVRERVERSERAERASSLDRDERRRDRQPARARYFFKTNCADLDTVIQEEVCCDADTLPMFEGKVMARVKSVE
ncbi:Axis inhibition protein, axin [Operophtera brumata]|uniref:Axis inhibition protein, axin n=1 Tax=Operophtera brumata TaxID=104452 RepID=A0A0L7L020_OPEBR|nr:Axis inhibition protein, axin [Operophtera brumata]